ncbi:class I SAM-dependent methyltransferase [Tumidithrix elongata RA019]|uniref:Class I SAM-dependent methyltransferase n=1 Tax=Tumidithrix elongata BACA0141 TaxID=2716417 RepID=A0AAW9PUQ6_9CYAN|nr:class I SAM-dependent methyltransferase [Tumidithrix elongata RA019]
MPATTTPNPAPRLASRLVNGVLAIKPLAKLAKHQARKMMIERAESMGVAWRNIVATLRSQDLESDLAQVENPNLKYPEYYLRPFHAYDRGNLGWEAATEVEVAAYAVHSRIWKKDDPKGDAQLRQSYHDILTTQISTSPKDILDVGCSVGMSTFALQATYPQAKITGLDLSPNFLAIANYNTRQRHPDYAIDWVHAAAESTGFADASFDLVSIFLVYHELPQTAAIEIIKEAKRILRPQGHLAIMDMNPQSEIYAKMPPYILTLLKSTEPYLDEYFALDLQQAIETAGFKHQTLTSNSPRHRTLIAQV